MNTLTAAQTLLLDIIREECRSSVFGDSGYADRDFVFMKSVRAGIDFLPTLSELENLGYIEIVSPYIRLKTGDE